MDSGILQSKIDCLDISELKDSDITVLFGGNRLTGNVDDTSKETSAWSDLERLLREGLNVNVCGPEDTVNYFCPGNCDACPPRHN